MKEEIMKEEDCTYEQWKKGLDKILENCRNIKSRILSYENANLPLRYKTAEENKKEHTLEEAKEYIKNTMENIGLATPKPLITDYKSPPGTMRCSWDGTHIKAVQQQPAAKEIKREDLESGKLFINSFTLGDVLKPEVGVKKDEGKLPLGIIIQKQFPNALKAIAECSKYGNDKYKETDKDWCNLHRVENGEERYLDAAMRHLVDAGKDLKEKDPDTKLEHIKHSVWNMLALLEIIELKKKL